MSQQHAEQFVRVVYKIRNLHEAWRVWNWIDHQDNPEPLWCFMRHVNPQYYDYRNGGLPC